MALWEQTKKCAGQLKELQSIYGEHFPIELRDLLATWIELQPWSEVVPSNMNHQLHASTLFNDMLACLKKFHENLRQPFIVRFKAEQHAAAMKLRYQNQPLEYVRVVQNCLLKERQLVDQHAKMSVLDTANPIAVIDRGLEQITQLIEKLEANYRALHERQEHFVIRYQEVIKLDAALKQAGDQLTREHLEDRRQRKTELDDHLKKEVEVISRLRQDLGNSCYKCLQDTLKIQNIVLDQQLPQWRGAQRLCGLDEVSNKEGLDQLERWCEQLAELLWRIRVQILQFDKLRNEVPINDPQDPGVCHHLQTVVNSMLRKLIQESYIIEKQPPQVLKIRRSFSADIRLLVGSKLNIHMSTPEVEASIVNDKQARQVFLKQTLVQENVGEIINHKRNMEYHAADQSVICRFSSLQIKNKVRRSTGSDHNVTEEKFAIVFQSVIHVANELEFVVKVISLPVVVVVHQSQQPSAEATIFWDNYFAEPDRELFAAPEQVPWSSLSQALSNYFEIQTGRGLNEQNLEFLGKKLQSVTSSNMDANPYNFIVTYSVLAKEHMQPLRKGEKGTSFWEWFYATCDLVRCCIMSEWKSNLVHGFLDRQEAHDLLQKCPQGTFLIRFSQSQAGLSVAFKKMEDDIRDLVPWVKGKLLTERKMSDRLQDLGELKYLYPSRDKNEAFQEYYNMSEDEEEQSQMYSGYFKSVMRESMHTNGAIYDTVSQPSPSSLASPVSHLGLSPFPVTSPHMSMVDMSPLNPMLDFDLTMLDNLGDDLKALKVLPDVSELPEQISYLCEVLTQGNITYSTDQLRDILRHVTKLKSLLEQKLSLTNFS